MRQWSPLRHPLQRLQQFRRVGAGVPAPLAGNVVKVLVNQGDSVAAGDVVVILEAMKMETEVRASEGGVVSALAVREGDAVKVGDTLLRL